MNKFNINYNKILKLNNVIKIKILEDDSRSLDTVAFMMENYIKSKGFVPVGPIVQHLYPVISENGMIRISVELLIQSSNYIEDIEQPYEIFNELKVENCLYLRFTGEEQKLSFGYSKLNLIAFEEDIKLKGDNYTIFLKQEDDILTADIFMEKILDE